MKFYLIKKTLYDEYEKQTVRCRISTVIHNQPTNMNSVNI